MRVEIPRNRGVRNLVTLMLGLFITIPDQNRVFKDALLGEEFLDKIVPVRQIITALRTLSTKLVKGRRRGRGLQV